MSEKSILLESIGLAYRAWKSVEQDEAKKTFKQAFDKLLYHYLTMFLINLGAEEGSYIRCRTVDHSMLVEFGNKLAAIKNYDMTAEELEGFRKWILK